MLRRWGVVLLAAALGIPLVAPGSALAEPEPPTWRGDRVVRNGTGERLAVPPAGTFRGSAPAATPVRYALSYVVIPMKRMHLRFSKAKVKAMTERVSNRMSRQTDGRISYGFAAYSVAEPLKPTNLTCDLNRLDARYRKYAKHRRVPPPGYRDTVVVYVTPPRFTCAFSGVAVLGGNRVYLNGLDLRDPQRLQDWITAHELGHTLGLEHSASFWLPFGRWTPDQRIPATAGRTDFAEYGDYLDLMGQPPRGGYRIEGARLGSWLLDSPNLLALGVLGGRNTTVIRRSGTYQLDRLVPASSGGRMVLAIPVRANGSRTFWTLEYRPASLNSALRYPEPWATRAYGVRLILLGHGRRYRTSLNKTFHRNASEGAYGTLPVGTNVKLGGGSTVRVNILTPGSTSVTVVIRP